MARTIKKSTTKKTNVTVSRPETTKVTSSTPSMFERMRLDLQNNQSILNLILGSLVIVVMAVLLFNYFNRPGEELTPAQNTENQQAAQTDENGDVTKEGLPGNYTVKAGDTLFTIAQNYYDDGYQYTRIVEANNLSNPNAIEEGQVLTIPAREEAVAEASPSAEPTTVAEATEQPSAEPTKVAQATPAPQTTQGETLGTGGQENATIWGTRITTDTYTVQEGDWLSTIAGRAYGDIMAYEKIAQANNIQNPDVIEPGMVIQLPR